MPQVNIATVFTDEIEKHFRNHLPKEAVGILMLMGQQMLDLEKAFNSQQRMIEKMMQFMVLEGNALKEIKKHQADLDRQAGLINSAEIGDN